jgi:membrane-bound lytic murein transglycosylase A
MGGGDSSGKAQLKPTTFAELDGWADDDHAAAFAAFRAGAGIVERHPPKARALGVDPAALARILTQAGTQGASPSPTAARSFFEAAFEPFEVVPESGGAFFTGYYEPEVAGSRVRTVEFSTPLYRPPPDLVEVGPSEVPQLDSLFRFAIRTAAGHAEHADRRAIMDGALAGRDLELVWLADPVDAFFIHIQGAARIRLTEGGTMRLTYAAKSGHPYTPIGRVLIDMGALTKDEATMQGIRAWLAAHPDKADAVMARNRSYIFFREAPVTDDRLGPIAAAKVPLTPMRSLAVDRLLHTFHAPVWVETTLPDGASFRRLMVAQDTGSAIVGPARGDIFFGSGDAAGEIAGRMRAGGRFVVLTPRRSR